MPHGMWGIAFFPKTFPGSRPSQWQHTFYKSLRCRKSSSADGFWLVKIYASACPARPVSIRYRSRRIPLGLAITILRVLFPFPVIVSLYRFFSLKKSLTLRSQISCALAPLAYIRFKRTWSRNPRRFFRVWEPEQDGHFAKGKDSPRLNGFLFYRHPPDRIGKHSRRFKVPVLCISGKRSKRCESRRFLVDTEHPRSVSIHRKNPSTVS